MVYDEYMVRFMMSICTVYDEYILRVIKDIWYGTLLGSV